MGRKGILLWIHFLLFTTTFAQSSIDHWESLVNAGNLWRYFPGTSEPLASWTSLAFDDATWNEGPGGFGYGDGDDGTVITGVTSVYLRKKFTINSLAEIEKSVLLADYDDAFVAYLNGFEIARGGIGSALPAYNQFADSQHEASLYQGEYPTEVVMGKSLIDQLFVQGENILSIQVHDITATSSDLSSNFYLLAGLNVANTAYQPIPLWFKAPLDFESSNLPIVKINTGGKTIFDEPKIVATMGIIDNGPGKNNAFDDPFNGYNGNIGIEIRGSSSQMFPKKQYGIELWTATGQDTAASLLGLPEEEDWVLYAAYSDKSLIRNMLTYKLAADQGRYAPKTRLCEVYINEEYMGVYVLIESIKRDKNRVNINKLGPEENLGEDLTGGYIVKLDKITGSTSGLGWESPYNPPNSNGNQVVYFQYDYPKEDEITTQQREFIQEYFNEFEKALQGPNFSSTREGYRKYIDVSSFIDFAIINELSRNVDGYRLSTFLYKDKNDKINIGPVWDFNLAFGNANYCDGGMTTGWAWDFNKVCNGDGWLIPFWWQRLLRDPQYVMEFQNRWSQLRTGIFSNSNIINYIDSVTTVLGIPQQRNFTKWPILSEWIWPNNFVGNSYPAEVTYLKNWVADRLNWLDRNIERLEVITGVEDVAKDQMGISVYPNPTNGHLQFHLTHLIKSMYRVNMHDQLGRIVLTKDILPDNSYSFQIDARQLSGGMYFVRIFCDEKLVHTEKIMVNR